MKIRMMSIALIIAILVGSFGAIAMPTPVAAKQGLSQAITGTVENGGTFNGTLHITKFAVQNGKLVAVGTLTGTIFNAAGKKSGNVNQKNVAVPVSGNNSSAAASTSSLAADQTCSILNLVLGPLDLTLLGLHVHLNTVVLTIDANPVGGLLGQLLCSVANLLNNPLADLLQISNLLNQILQLLN